MKHELQNETHTGWYEESLPSILWGMPTFFTPCIMATKDWILNSSAASSSSY